MKYRLMARIAKYCADNEITKEEFSEKLGISRQYLHDVARYERPMPAWMVKRLSRLFKLDEQAVGVEFGYYPQNFVKYCRKDPEKATGDIKKILEREGYGSKSEGLLGKET